MRRVPPPKPYPSSDIRIYILDDILKWRMPEKSYGSRESDYGIHISFDQYHSWFLRFLKQMRNEDYEKCNAISIVSTNPKILRLFILCDVIAKKSFETSYSNLCDLIGHRLDYPDFDYWYHQFYQGDHNLDYCRTTKRLEFADLTVDVIGRIVEKTNLKTQLTLRKVCSSLRDLIDTDHYSLCDTIRLNYTITGCFCKFNETHVVYSKRTSKHYAFIDSSLNSVNFFISNPKLRLKSLNIQLNHWIELKTRAALRPDYCSWKAHRGLRALFDTVVTHRIHTQKIKLVGREQDDVEHVLAVLKPKVLEKIEIDNHGMWTIWTNLNGICRLEQWKEAKEATIERPFSFRIRDFQHFDRFDVAPSKLTIQDLVAIRDAISTSPNFKNCKLRTAQKPKSLDIRNGLNLAPPPSSTTVTGRHPDYGHFYEIPDSKRILVFNIDDNHICIEKIV